MKLRVVGEFLLIYVLPVSLILAGALSFDYRFAYLTGVSLITMAFSVAKKTSFAALGLSTDGLKEGLRLNGLLCLIFALFLLLAYHGGLVGRKFVPQHLFFYMFYIFVSCPMQEFVYRSYFFVLLDKVSIVDSRVRICLNALAFSYLHAIYMDWLTIIFTFVIGALWAAIYQRTRNVYGLCLSHAVFGTITILAGLV
jgi:uncharacterized protein